MIKLDPENFHEYFDSGSGNPFEEEEVISFCVEQSHLFTTTAIQSNTECFRCEAQTSDVAYFFNFYDHEEDYNIIKKYISDLPSFEDIEEELATICFIPCKTCGYWVVTH